MACWKMIARGKVQGVFYRKSVLEFVESSGLTLQGYVKNLADQTVEVVAQGEQRDLEALLSFCQKGPPLSRVSAVDVEILANPVALKKFCVEK